MSNFTDVLPTCSAETHSCQCQCEDACIKDDDGTVATTLNILTWELNCLRLERRTAEFEAMSGIRVNIQCVTAPLTRDEFHAEILSEAKTQTGLHDGYTLGPHLYGDLDLLEGLHDLTPLIREGAIGSMGGFDLNWNDIFLFARENGAVYDRKIVGMPIDGDVHSLYYRRDLFDKYNKTPPATWEEYTELAKFFHGKVEPLPGNATQQVEITGSCVGKLERTEFWVFLVLSSMTQNAGTRSGNLFDPVTMEPLLGEAFVKTLQFMEEQFAYGAETEYTGSFKDINLDKMNEGRCAMTYMWGDSFTEGAKAPPTSYIAGYLGTAPTPGSKVYLDRETQMLKDCTDTTCSCNNAVYKGHETDTDCINSAPYAAFTGWAGACSNYTTPDKKRACAEFFGYISSPATSVDDTIPNVTVGAPFIIVDPFRNSHTRLVDWTDRGLPEEMTKEYIDTIKNQLNDPNVALDMRIPGSADFQAAMNAVFRDHLGKVEAKRLQGLVGDDLLLTDYDRWEAELEVRNRWKKIINLYDRTHSPPLLEVYQRNLGVYSEDAASGSSIGAGPIVAIVVAILAVIVGAVFFVVREKQRKNDQVWKIEKDEIKFEDPPQIVGRGRFGVVLLAEYRGSEVAVKRVAHVKENQVNQTGTMSSPDFEKWFQVDEESAIPATEHKKEDSMGTRSGGTERTKEITRSITRVSGGTSQGNKAMTSRQIRKDFKNEMRLISSLRHQCITTAVGAYMNSSGDPMLVMEYMQHGSLYDILHNNTMVLEGPMLLQMVGDIAQGVRFLHACKPPVIHCDLKAANILVDNRFRAKVADFGLSSRAGAGAIGTPFWMAPEILQGGSNTEESDVYAFGIVLFEAFARKEPYDGEDPVEVLKLVCDKSVNKRPPAPKDSPPHITSVMSDCLVADPAERPSFEELDKRIKRIDAKKMFLARQSRVHMNSVPTTSISLDDIFPAHIAKKLKNNEPIEPEHHDIVTIFFSDIVGFTDISGQLEPRKVAKMLGRLYNKLDKVAEKHEVFKVETIGDAYMAVTNLVKDQPDDHVKRIAEFAADALEAANDTLIDEDNPEKGVLSLRVGLHCGPVVSDVVGSLNPRYCLFGDTVNTASRMESNSEPGRINCSSATAKLLQVQKPGVSVTSRGMINVKGKGMMHTYWVNRD
ncbi:activated protein kinase catalytic subunit alpha-1 [Seminavis robusta]|uniref:Guanylate cyclase n=1 Tax=Seminavis robusta TaxID=568900 RepID=A0A9N8DSS3_9STRA|nr:activated protein kinase catalytic subunit alpha-1 [Seminavis robusta]|eukprot:Sro262_g102070.1 activated protein kinase catalytic subunit alpha-1 (1153) ;mRNA; r:61950-66007